MTSPWSTPDGKQLAKAADQRRRGRVRPAPRTCWLSRRQRGRPIPVAIETCRGLLVARLRATGRPVFAINPLAVARYRDRHSVARRKSDAGDAAVLANILRTDMAAHRPLPADSELAQAIAVLARAQQDAVWDRSQAHNKLRSQLREFYPAILAAFAEHKLGLLRPEARTILAAAPTPTAAAQLTRRQLRALLKRAGRVRGIDAEADRLHEVCQRDYLHHSRRSKPPSAIRPPPCSASWTPPAPTPTSSKCRHRRPSTSIPTRRSSPACPASAPYPAPAFWPRSATTGPGSPTPAR